MCLNYVYVFVDVLVLMVGEVELMVLSLNYIYLVCCMPRFPLVGKTPSKVSNIYMCVLGIHENLYAHIKGEFSLLIELGEFIHTIF